MRRILFLLICAGMCCGMYAYGAAEEISTLQHIDFKNKTRDSATISFVIHGKLQRKIFMLHGEKPRLVVDFLGAVYRGGSKIKVHDSELVRGIRIGYHSKPQRKTRVVVDLVKQSKFVWKEEQKAEELVLFLGRDIAPSPVPSAEKVIVSSSPEKQKPVPKSSLEPSALSVVEAKKTELTKGITFPVVPPGEVALSPKSPAAVSQKVIKKVASARPEDISSQRNASLSGASGPSLFEVAFQEFENGEERVLFKLDDFHPPIVSAIVGANPRVVCDFYKMQTFEKVIGVHKVTGRYVKNIRVAQHENPGKVRVVLDLVPGNDYALHQFFFNEDNLFVLVVKSDDVSGRNE